MEYDKNNSRDSNQILLDDKEQQLLIVSCTQTAKSVIMRLLCVAISLQVRSAIRGGGTKK